jgi:hypothetical protein
VIELSPALSDATCYCLEPKTERVEFFAQVRSATACSGRAGASLLLEQGYGVI